MILLAAVGLAGTQVKLHALLGEVAMGVVMMRDLAALKMLLSRVEHAVGPLLALIDVAHGDAIVEIERVWPEGDLKWVGFTPSEDPSLIDVGYAAGAAAMMPIHASPAVIAKVLRRIVERIQRDAIALPHAVRAERAFRAGEILSIPSGHVGIIRRGVVSLQGFDADGCPFLLGFAGAGEALMVAAEEGLVDVSHVTHTSGSLVLMSWDTAIHDPIFHTAQGARIAAMEYWARIRAGAYVEERIVDTLRVLARLAGRPHPRGIFIEVRITHSQLAAAVGATRSTITRVLGSLRQSGRVLLVRDSNRVAGYCLPSQSIGAIAAGA